MRNKGRRMYHELKAQRCVENLDWMRRKLHNLESVRLKKIEDLKEEIGAIEDSLVTKRCIVCGSQFSITFREYSKPLHSSLCHRCLRSSNKKFIDNVLSVLSNAGITGTVHYNRIEISLPNKD